MRQKVSTLVNAALFRQIKLEAVRSNKQISEIVGEALELYLQRARAGRRRGDVAGESWGALPLNSGAVKRILEEEEGLFEA
ncbi:MAG: hypothetical protein ACE5JX_05120 [Acidobacteriota bacterium]